MYPYMNYENVSLCEIDSGSEEEGSKIGEGVRSMVKSCRWPHQLILNLFLVAAQYNFFIVIVVVFSTPEFSYGTQNVVVATIGVFRKFS